MSCEKKFQILSQIQRASHFEWRRAALAVAPDLDPMTLVLKYWEEVGHDTAAAYLKQYKKRKEADPDLSAAEFIAESFVWSSVNMGEDAKLIPEKAGPGEAYMRHDDCPWYHWHKRLDLVAEDQPGCDKWLETLISDINEALGTNVKFETVESLPAGGTCCLRRVWEE